MLVPELAPELAPYVLCSLPESEQATAIDGPFDLHGSLCGSGEGGLIEGLLDVADDIQEHLRGVEVAGIL